MSQKAMRGVFTILVTPFDEKSRVDEESLRRLVEFNLQAGVHGVGVALGSEIFRLSEAEREQVTRVVVSQVRGRVPVVINTGGGGTELAVFYSVRAEECGADALMVMPPTFMPVGSAEIREYFMAISAAVRIPIFIQDTSASPVSADLARQITEESEQVRYIKVESYPLPLKVAEAVNKAGKWLTVFGGAGGNYFIEEMRRGSAGTMPGCSQPEAFVEVWNRFQGGDEPGARAVFDQEIAAVNRLVDHGWGAFYHVHKEILRQRGIIRCATVRGPIAPLDNVTAGEIKKVVEILPKADFRTGTYYPPGGHHR